MEEQIINFLHMGEAVNGLTTSICFGISSKAIHDVSANKEPAEEVLLCSQNKSAHAAKRSSLNNSFLRAHSTQLSQRNDRDCNTSRKPRNFPQAIH